MGKAGETAAAAKRCDELGIDPSWPLPERVSRMIDIEHGSGRMSEEVVRGADYSRAQVSTEFFGSSSKDKEEKKVEREKAVKEMRDREEQHLKESRVSSPTMKKLVDYLRKPEIANDNQNFSHIFGTLSALQHNYDKLPDKCKKRLKEIQGPNYLSELSGNMKKADDKAYEDVVALYKEAREAIHKGSK